MEVQQIEIDKSKIISWVNQLQDHDVLEKIALIMRSKEEPSLTFEQKKAIDEAINSIETKGTFSNELVKAETQKRYPHLFKN